MTEQTAETSTHSPLRTGGPDFLVVCAVDGEPWPCAEAADAPPIPAVVGTVDPSGSPEPLPAADAEAGDESTDDDTIDSALVTGADTLDDPIEPTEPADDGAPTAGDDSVNADTPTGDAG